MTTLANARRFETAAPSRSLVALAVALYRYFHRWQKIRADRALLQSMPDSLLADIGIGRSAIDRATAFGRDF